MADIKIDISDIINRHLYSTLISGLVSLLSYQVKFHEWVQSTIVFIGSFLIVEFVIWFWQKRNRNIAQKEYEKGAELKTKQTMKDLAEKVLSFFRCIDDFHLDAAIELYKYPLIPNSHYNERFVKFGDMPISGKLSYLEYFNQSLFQDSTAYIVCENEIGYNNCGISHYLIDPLFYAILKNYIKTGVKDYPIDFDFMKLASFYKL